MRQEDLIGIWSADSMYGPGSHSDQWLIFKPDGTGRFEEININLCWTDLFRWGINPDGTLQITGTRCLYISDNEVLEKPSDFTFHSLHFSVQEEDTPSGRRMIVLRVNFGKTWIRNNFGLGRRDIPKFLEEPRFNI